MNNDSPVKAIMMVTATALVCSILVTITAVTLQPTQRAYKDLERNRAIVSISGLTEHTIELSDREIINLFKTLDARIVDLDSGEFDTNYNPDTFDTWKAAGDPKFSIAIPAQQDLAKLSRRSRLITVYIVKDNTDLKRMLVPIYGKGMWSMLYGFIALEADLNTIADITFYEQAETAGIGDQILRRDWLASWQGRKLYDEHGTMKFRIGAGMPESTAVYQVDSISGATITVDAVKNLVHYWFGQHGLAPFLQAQRRETNR